MNKEFNNDKIAGTILSSYGIRVKSSDEIIPFYGMMMDLTQKVDTLSKEEKKGTTLSFQNEKQAFWFGFGKWLNVTLCLMIILIGFKVYANFTKTQLPEAFMKNSVLVTTKTKDGKPVTGYLLNKGERESYQTGKHYIPGKNDGTIIVPLE